uniref:IMS_C domain-containing protein n=1 Tax=Anisakis simplex TaxID=6269 RepID=A0A0M3JEN3_ANISI
LMHGLEKLMECFEANACLSSIQLTESSISKPVSDMHKMPQLTADDLSAKGDEVEVQQKALETLRRYKTRRRHNIPTLRITFGLVL